MSGLWLAVPLAPLLLALGPLWRGDRAIVWLPLGCLPALWLVWSPAPVLEVGWVFEGMRLGGDDRPLRAWLGFTALLWLCASLFAGSSLREAPRRERFWTFWQLSQAGNLLLVIAADAFSFYLGFSLMSLAAYGLIVHFPGPGPRRAGRLYLQLALAGEMALLGAILLRTHAAGGAFGFAEWAEQPVDGLTLALLLLGLGIKAGFWPLHVWLPLAHPVAPAPASAVLSGAMIKAGFLGLWRCLPASGEWLASASGGLLAVGLLGAFYAALLGICSDRAKTALAYSSVSQMGWMAMLLALAWQHPEQRPEVAALLAIFGVHHGLAKGALFLGAGLAQRTHLPAIAWVLMGLPAAALAGLPLSSGASVKIALKEIFSLSDFSAWTMLLGPASAFTALLLLRVLWLMYREQAKAPEPPPLAREWLSWALLCLLSLLLPWTWPAMGRPLVGHLGPIDHLELAWPLVLAAVLGLVALRLHLSAPPALSQPPQPWLRISLRLKRLVQQPPLRDLQPHPDRSLWRRRERRWNRFWARSTLALSVWLMVLLLWLGWWR